MALDLVPQKGVRLLLVDSMLSYVENSLIAMTVIFKIAQKIANLLQ
ncbi:MAG: hypothetical protein ACP8RL_03740 [cyanobacterium endosymbiont of Rhopalodia inflata]